MGVASIRCVRPAFTTSACSALRRRRVAASAANAGSRSWATPSATATCTAVGKVSLLDWLALTTSLAWTSRPSARPARVATTSLTFMFVEVPLPVWNTSTGNWSAC